MELLTSIYNKSIAENEKNLHFWIDYHKSLINLQFEVYSNKLSVPIMVPVGSRILFRGELKHTNEVLVSLGADYFVKCSLNQAEILKQHRIKDAQSKINILLKEKEYLENQIEYGRQTVNNCVDQDIVEVYNEEEDKLWREKHRENVRQYKIQNKNKSQNQEAPDEEIWNRLDELELQEELENINISTNSAQTSESKQKESLDSVNEKECPVFNVEQYYSKNVDPKSVSQLNNYSVVSKSDNTSNTDLLQKILDRQNELEEKLQNIKNGCRSKCTSEKDLEERLDEIEQLDELEDEIDRLNDAILQSNSEEYNQKENINAVSKIKTKVMFLDKDDSETLEISFKHSAVASSLDPYNPIVGIQKPSDIYFAYDILFNTTFSILKKKRYDCDKEKLNNFQTVGEERNDATNKRHEMHVNNTITISDVKERQNRTISTSGNGDAKPMSLFKRQRLQKRI